MPISLWHITADSTWLLTLTSSFDPPQHSPFTILIDPWLDGPSPVFHPMFSVQNHNVPASIGSLQDLDKPPDIVVISQDKSDHCHEDTCRQLPSQGVTVYAVPGADKTVRSWKHFHHENVIGLKAWGSRRNGWVEKIPIYSDGERRGSHEFNATDVVAWVELTYLPALKMWEMPILHSAVGITYTPVLNRGTISALPSPPETPPDERVPFILTQPEVMSSTTQASGAEHQSSTIPTESSKLSRSRTLSPGAPVHPYGKNPCDKNHLTESIIYTPHGVPPSALLSYLESIPRPLTMLLHCFDHVQTPLWLGGIISSGAPNAVKLLEILHSTLNIADKGISIQRSAAGTNHSQSTSFPFGVKYWISTHDEVKSVGGFVSSYVRTKRWGLEEVYNEILKILPERTEFPENNKIKKSDSEHERFVGGLSLLEMDVGERRDFT